MLGPDAHRLYLTVLLILLQQAAVLAGPLLAAVTINWAIPEGADFLCGVLVFVEEASSAVAALDAEGLEVDHVVRQRLEQGGLAENPVRAMFAVEGFVLAEQSELWVPITRPCRSRVARLESLRTCVGPVLCRNSPLPSTWEFTEHVRQLSDTRCRRRIAASSGMTTASP